MQFNIKGKEIWYADRIWKNSVRCIPPDERLHTKIILSRNKIPAILERMFEMNEQERQEYENAKTEDEIADIIIKDAKSKGCVLINREKIENENQ